MSLAGVSGPYPGHVDHGRRGNRTARALSATDRVVARSLALGAGAERVTRAQAEELWLLAGGDRAVLVRALQRVEQRWDGRPPGRPGELAGALLRSALAPRKPREKPRTTEKRND